MPYTVVRSPHNNNSVTYKDLSNGQLTAREDVPQQEREKIWLAAILSEMPTDICLFCGQPSPNIRLVNGQTIALCNDHYHSMTVGKIVEKFRAMAHIREDTEHGGNERRLRTEAARAGHSQGAGAKQNDRQLQEDSGSQG